VHRAPPGRGTASEIREWADSGLSSRRTPRTARPRPTHRGQRHLLTDVAPTRDVASPSKGLLPPHLLVHPLRITVVQATSGKACVHPACMRRCHDRVVTDLAQPCDFSISSPAPLGHSRTGLDADSLRRGIVDHLRYSIGRPAAALKPEHYYRAFALAVRDRMQDNRVASTQASLEGGGKVTCYLSAEFLMGPQLGANLLNLGIEQVAAAALQELGQDLGDILACEQEPGLGNGGLGRLAACTWIRWPRWNVRPSAMASATSSASSTRRSTTAPTSGWSAPRAAVLIRTAVSSSVRTAGRLPRARSVGRARCAKRRRRGGRVRGRAPCPGRRARPAPRCADRPQRMTLANCPGGPVVGSNSARGRGTDRRSPRGAFDWSSRGVGTTASGGAGSNRA
jgi:Carbohydrate phosphorylase